MTPLLSETNTLFIILLWFTFSCHPLLYNSKSTSQLHVLCNTRFALIPEAKPRIPELACIFPNASNPLEFCSYL